MNIKEGVSGTWYYHWADGDAYTAKCGAIVMNTEMTENQWGLTGYLNERWCSKCAEIKEGLDVVT